MKRAGILFLFLLMGSLWLCKDVSHAGTIKSVSLWDKDQKTMKADITGDGKKDIISFTQKKPGEGYYVDKFIVKVNGKKALTIKNSQGLHFQVTYARLTKKREFLQISSVAENDYLSTNRIYSYNKKTKKLEKKVNLMKTPCSSAYIKSVKKSQIVMTCWQQYMEVGSIQWNYVYKVSDKQIWLSSTETSSVKSNLGDVDYPGDGCEKYFKKNQFKALKSIPMYTDIDGTTEAFTAKKDDVLKLSGLRMKSKTAYLLFELDGEKGWLKIEDKDIYDFDSDDPASTGLFYGVYSRLAG